MAGTQDKPIGKSLLWMPNIPAHRPTQEQGEHSVDFRARATWVTALPVVENDIYELVDDVGCFFPMDKMLFQLLISFIDERFV
jgi:hypothetical protein